MEQVTIAGYPVQLQRKDVVRLKVTIVPPRGELRVTAPLHMPEETIARFLQEKADWIRTNTARYQDNAQRPSHHYTAGEIIRLFDAPLTLKIRHGVPSAVHVNGTTLVLTVPYGNSEELRRKVIERWYHQQMEGVLPPMVRKWEYVLQVHALSWRIHPMKSRWGSCNPTARSINLNLRLAAMPMAFLEYVVVHELCHLHVSAHNKQFWNLVQLCLPDYQQRRAALNAYHEDLFADLPPTP